MLNNLKYIIRKNKMMILVISVILICSVAIAFGVYAQITNRGTVNINEEEENNYIELKNNFSEIFTNNVNRETTTNLNINYNEILYCAYDIKENQSGKYSIDARVPQFKLETEETKKINKEIFDTFAQKIIDIIEKGALYATYNLDYVAYINNNIFSLVIRCNYKEGSNPQRTIVQTYNYDLENNKLLNLQEILDYKKLNREEVQNKIKEEIKEANGQGENINDQGYNVFIRNEQDSMYQIDNTANFFLGKNNYLYIVYAYGNNNYTNKIDLIIF